MTIENRNIEIIELLKNVNIVNQKLGIPIDMNEELMTNEQEVLQLANQIIDYFNCKPNDWKPLERASSFAICYDYRHPEKGQKLPIEELAWA